MDTTETQNRQGSSDKRSHDNVVRLPRDWLGPREDLVPFGPSAYPDEPEQTRELPRNADDFWGGADLADGDAATAGPAAAIPPTRRLSLPRLPRLPRARVELGFGPRMLLVFGLGVLAILAGIGLVMGSAGRRPSAVKPRTHAAVRTATAALSFDLRAMVLRDTAVARAARARARENAMVHRRAELRRRQRAEARRHRQHPSTHAVQPVHYTTPAPTPASDSAGSSSGTSGSAVASASANPSPHQASSLPASTANSASSSSQSSSSSQPAIGANGTLGPGSSPDG